MKKLICGALLASLSFANAQKIDTSGAKVTRFVDHKNITAPAGMSVSPNGVVYVSSDPNAARSGLLDVGKIYRCEDTDKDGVADKVTVFLDKVNAARGSCFVGDTLYLLHPPLLSALRDTDGDGVADEKKVLINGVGQGVVTKRVDHAQNGVRMAIDGWLYLSIGDQGCYQATGTDGSQATLFGGGVLRVRPDGSNLEVFSTNVRNIYNVAIDPYLDIFTRDNTNDGGGWNTRFHHIPQLADFGYPRLYKHFGNEAMASMVDYGGGSGTGMYYLHEPGFPNEMSDMLISNDYNSGIFIHPKQRHEDSYRIKQQLIMPIRQPLVTDVDGFSAMYIASWAGGSASYTDKKFGFVERVTYPGLKAAEFPDLAKATDEDLLKHITSRSQVTRINTMSEILKRGENPALINGLEAIIQDKKQELYNRVASIFALKQLIGAKSHKLLIEITADEDLREFAVRALADRTDQLKDIPKGFIAKFLNDKNPRVRLQAVTALARVKDKSAVKSIFALAQSEKMIVDDRLKQVSKVGADGSLSAPITALPHVSLQALMILSDTQTCFDLLDNESYRETALRILQTRHTEEVVDGLISKLESSKDEELKKLVMLALFRLYHQEQTWDGKSWWNTRPNYKGPYFKPTEWAQTSKIKTAIEKAYPTFSKEGVREIMSVMRLNQVLPSNLTLKIDYDEVVDLLTLESLTAAQGATLINAAIDKSRSNQLKVKIFHKLDSVAGIDVFVEKVKLLKAWNADKTKNDLLKSTYTDFVNTTRYVSDVKSLGLLMKNRRAGIGIYAHIIAFNMIRNPVVTENVKAKVRLQLDEVIAHERQAESTAKALIQFESISDLISKEQLQKLDDNGRKAVRTNFKKIKALYKTTPSRSGDLVSAISYDSLKKEIAKPGNDIANGKALFIRQGCSICHTVDESIAPKGPFLGSVGTKFSREFIAESIVKPSEVMAQGFVTKWFKLKNGNTVEGFVTGYDGPAFEIRNVAGIVSKIEKTQIVESGVRETSMMPPGLAGNLTVKEFNALLDYLQSLK